MPAPVPAASDPARVLAVRAQERARLEPAGLLSVLVLVAAGFATARYQLEPGAQAATKALTLLAAAALAPLSLLRAARAIAPPAVLVVGCALVGLPHLGVLRLAVVLVLVLATVAAVAVRTLDPRAGPLEPTAAVAVAVAAQLATRGDALWLAPAAPATWVVLLLVPFVAGIALARAGAADPGATLRAAAFAAALFAAGGGWQWGDALALVLLALIERLPGFGARLRLALATALALPFLWLGGEPPWLVLFLLAAALVAAGTAGRGSRAARAILVGLALAAAIAAALPWRRPAPAASAIGAIATLEPTVVARPIAAQPVVLTAAAPRFEAALGGEPIGGWVLDSYLVQSTSLTCGRALVQIRIDGAPAGVLQVGRDSAEWAAARSDVAAALACPSPPAWSSWFPASGRFLGHHYRSRGRLTEPTAARRIVLERDPTLLGHAGGALPSRGRALMRRTLLELVAALGAAALLQGLLPPLASIGLRATLVLLPVPLALLAAVGRAAPAGRARPAELAAGVAWIALALGHDNLGLPESATLVAALGLLWIGWRIVRLARVLAGDLARPGASRDLLPFVLLPAAFYLLLLPWTASARAPNGDEPYYLLLAHSIAEDFDLDLADDYRDEAWRAFSDQPILPQPGDPTGPNGEIYSRHEPALPLLIAPAYAAAGRFGALVVMVAIASLCAGRLVAAARRLPGVGARGAVAAWALFAFAPPLPLYGQQIWVEVPAALLFLLAIEARLRLRAAAGRAGVADWLRLLLPLALLPLLKLRLLAIALPYALLALAGMRKQRRLQILLVAGFALVVVAILVTNQILFGNPLKMHSVDDLALASIPLERFLRGGLGLWFDLAFGLLASAPLWLLAVPAIARALVRVEPLALELAAIAPYLLLTASRREWYGGFSPPFRYGLVVLPVLALAIARLLSVRLARPARAATALLAATTLPLALIALALPTWTNHLADGSNHLLDRLGERFTGDLLRFFPSAVRPSLATWLVPLLVVAAGARRLREPRPLAPPSCDGRRRHRARALARAARRRALAAKPRRRARRPLGRAPRRTALSRALDRRSHPLPRRMDPRRGRRRRGRAGRRRRRGLAAPRVELHPQHRRSAPARGPRWRAAARQAPSRRSGGLADDAARTLRLERRRQARAGRRRGGRCGRAQRPRGRSRGARVAMSRVVAVVPSLGLGPAIATMLATLRAELAGVAGGLVWVHQGSRAEPPDLDAPGERLIRLERPVGFAQAANLGIAAAAGARYVALVNDDATLEPGWLAALERALEERPEAAAAQGVNLLGDGSGHADGWALDWNRWRQAIQLGHGEPAPSSDRAPFEVFGVAATAALFRLDALGDLGGALGPFDERLGSYYEDADLALRLRARGHVALAVPAARAVHAGGATAGRAPARRWRQIYGNRWAVVARGAGRRLPLEAPRLAARDLADLVRAFGAGDLPRVAGILGGWSRAARLLPRFARAGAAWPPFARPSPSG